MRRSICFLAVIALLIPLNDIATAAPILDQSYTTISTNHSFRNQPGGRRDLAQTFQPGLNGLLTGIEVYLVPIEPDGVPVNLELQTQDGAGKPSGTVLASASLAAASIAAPGFHLFDISAAGQIVAPGQLLAIVISAGLDPTNGSQNYNAQGGIGAAATYPFGEFFERNNLGPWVTLSATSDIAFRTYVDTAAVPEPVTFALLLLGGAAMARRSRNV
jgi:hypothetical protein